nr:G-type lectin S-receptor-like serine/threonine-protein kinase SD3-1 [Ipomoea batatas]
MLRRSSTSDASHYGHCFSRRQTWARDGAASERSRECLYPYGVSVSWFDRTKNWVSKNGDFAFGFLEKYGGDDVDGFVVGIRYNLGYQGDINVPVWIVGGGLRKLAKSTAQFEEEYGAHRFLKSRREI